MPGGAPDLPDDRPGQKLTPEQAAVWILGIVLFALILFAITVAVLN